MDRETVFTEVEASISGFIDSSKFRIVDFVVSIYLGSIFVVKVIGVSFLSFF